jgi:hypothetical protein
MSNTEDLKGGAAHDAQVFIRGVEAVHRAMAQLVEFWPNVNIEVCRLNSMGQQINFALEQTEDEEDEQPTA